LAHIPRSRLPVLAHISKRFSATAQLPLYHKLKLSSSYADACVARLPALMTTLALRTYPHVHGTSFMLTLALALRSIRALSVLTLPPFDAELLAAAPGMLTLLADTLPYAFFDDFLAVLAPNCPLRIASTLYDGLRTAALFGALGSTFKVLVLVLAPDVDLPTCGRLLGALANTGAELELLELNLEGASEEVRSCPLDSGSD